MMSESSESTIINNDNIKTLVETYYNYFYPDMDSNVIPAESGVPNPLPPDLHGIQMRNWDVSRVTDMSRVFDSLPFFNEPLDGWNVSKVENMAYMFNYCISFNQPLNGWDVSKVENMAYMFYNCISFNQPINNWDVRKVENFDRMYEHCPILEEYKASLENFEKYEKPIKEQTMLLHAVGDDETIIRNDALGKMPYDVKRYIGQEYLGKKKLGGKTRRSRRRRKTRKSRKTRRSRRTRKR